MIFDDHDVHDDWNISQAWVEEKRANEWWNEHVKASAVVLLGLPAPREPRPEEHRDDEAAERVKEATTPRTSCEAFAFHADREADGARWSYYRDLGTRAWS